jgi:hypothetical protein
MEVMEARIAQAKANLTFPVFLGSTAGGSAAAESIVEASLLPLLEVRSFLSV